MSMKRLLVPVDLADSYGDLFSHAASLSDRFDAEVVLYHAIDFHDLEKYGELFDSFPSEVLRSKAQESANKVLNKLKDSPQLKNKKTKIVIRVTEDVARSINNVARDLEADVILVQVEGHKGIENRVLGHETRRVLRTASLPVLCLPRTGKTVTPEAPCPEYRKILFATDLSPVSEVLASKVLPLAKAFKSRVELLHVIQDNTPADYLVSGVQCLFDMYPDLKGRAKKKLTAHASQVFGEIEHGVHVRTGSPVLRIVEFVREQGIHLIALATRGRDSVGDYFLGSTTARVVRLLPCPVYVVPVGKSIAAGQKSEGM